MAARMLQHERIREHIGHLISEMSPGTMLPTENEIAAEFGVSRLTVHKVMSNLQRDGILSRIKGKGTFLSLGSKQVMRLGSSRRNGKIIIAYPDWFSEDIFFKVSIAERISRQQHFELVNIKLSPDTDYGILREFLMKDQAIKGIILIPPGAEISVTGLRTIASLGIPAVVLVLTGNYAMADNVYVVSQDSFEIGYIGVNHLIQRGHRRIGYVTNEPWNYNSRQICDGMKKAMQANGLRISGLTRPATVIKPGDDSMAAGYSLTAEILDRDTGVTALVYDSLPGVLSGMRLLTERGISVPKDISIICNAEYGKFERYMFPSITTVASDREAIVSNAFDIIRDPSSAAQRQLLITSQLQPRESVRSL